MWMRNSGSTRSGGCRRLHGAAWIYRAPFFTEAGPKYKEYKGTIFWLSAKALSAPQRSGSSLRNRLQAPSIWLT